MCSWPGPTVALHPRRPCGAAPLLSGLLRTDQAAQDLPMAIETPDSSDVPSIDTVISQPAIDENAGDLPAIESGSELVPAEEDPDGSGDEGS